jgi:ABC-type transport system involved in multi-copper enzyme maturation permease subunit
MFKMEITRIFTRPTFWLVLILGTILSVYASYIYWPTNVTHDFYLNYPRSPYVTWFLIGDMPSAHIYNILFPLLASIVFADSYAEDVNSGYIKNILTRVKKKKYYATRYISNFCVGGLVATFPLMLNFFINMLVFPLIENNYYYGMNLIQEQDIFHHIFYSNPLIYVFLRILLLFILGGVLASIGLTCSLFIKNRYIVIIIPFLVFMAIDVLMPITLSNLFFTFGSWHILLPIYLLIGLIGTVLCYRIIGDKNEEI